MPKRNSVAISEMIWCDEVVRGLTPSAALRYIFFIAYAKATGCKGVVTRFALEQVGGSEDDLQELIAAGLVQDNSTNYEIIKFHDWQDQNAVKSDPVIKKLPPRVLDPNFDPEPTFRSTFAEWPEALKPQWREKPTEALDSFKRNVGDSEELTAFQAAFQERLRVYREEVRPLHEKRQFLGSYKNFCTKWRDWIPKGYGVDQPAAETQDGPKAVFVDDFVS